MEQKFLLAFVLGLVFSSVHAFTLNVRFLQGTPAKIDFAYAVSTGSCASTSSTKCSFTQSKLGGIDGAHFTQFLKAANDTFKTMTPVVDKIHTSNFVELKIPGQSGVCHVNLLGKTTVTVNVNKNGTCV